MESLIYAELLKDISRGDENAYAELYDFFSKQTLDYIYSKVHDEAVSKDIMQDVFMSIWKNRKYLADITNFEAYLFSACRYRILTYLRRSSLFTNYESPLEHEMENFSDDNVEERIHYRYLLDIVDYEVENLPEKCQQVFKMSRFDYLSNKDIAQNMEIAESTVEKHINKALKRLKNATRHFFSLF